MHTDRHHTGQSSAGGHHHAHTHGGATAEAVGEAPARGTSEQHGHDKHAGHNVGMFRDKFWISLALTIPTLVWGHMLPRVLGYVPPAVPGQRWIAPVFGTAVFLYGG